MKWMWLVLVASITALMFYPINREFHFVDSVGGIFVGKIRVNLASQILADAGISDFEWGGHVMRVDKQVGLTSSKEGKSSE